MSHLFMSVSVIRAQSSVHCVDKVAEINLSKKKKKPRSWEIASAPHSILLPVCAVDTSAKISTLCRIVLHFTHEETIMQQNNCS